MPLINKVTSGPIPKVKITNSMGETVQFDIVSPISNNQKVYEFFGEELLTKSNTSISVRKADGIYDYDEKLKNIVGGDL